VLEAVVVDDAKEADVLAIMEGRPRQESRARAQEAWAREKDVVIPVIEEELSIGTRQVDAGGVRVTTHVSARSYAPTQWRGPAYEFGQQLRGRTPGRTWEAIESQAKAKWDDANPGTWERYSDAIRAGWETGP
jgi:hypothetical protein